MMSNCNCTPNSNCTKCSGNLAIGLLAGVAIGAAVGMLFAPHKGTVLRKIVRRKGEDIVDEVAETIEDQISQFSDTVTGKLESLKDDLMSKFASVTGNINS